MKEFSSDLRREAYRLALESAVSLGVLRIAVQGTNLEDETENSSLEDLESALAAIKVQGRLNVSLFSDHREPAASQGVDQG